MAYSIDDFSNSLRELLESREKIKGLRSEWQSAASDSPEEKEIDGQIKAAEEQQSEIVDDLEYMTRKILEKQIPGISNFVNFNATVVKLDFRELQSIVSERFNMKADDKSQAIIIPFDKNEQRSKDIIVIAQIEADGDFLKILAYPLDHTLKNENNFQKAVEVCNKYNEGTRLMKAYVGRDRIIALEKQDFIDGYVSRELVSRSLSLSVAASIKFFTEYNALLDLD